MQRYSQALDFYSDVQTGELTFSRLDDSLVSCGCHDSFTDHPFSLPNAGFLSWSSIKVLVYTQPDTSAFHLACGHVSNIKAGIREVLHSLVKSGETFTTSDRQCTKKLFRNNAINAHHENNACDHVP